jgi:hypothetical protein
MLEKWQRHHVILVIARGSTRAPSFRDPHERAAQKRLHKLLYQGKAAQASTSEKSGQPDIKTITPKRNNSAKKLWCASSLRNSLLMSRKDERSPEEVMLLRESAAPECCRPLEWKL